MSFSSHRKAVRNPSLPFPHRASHLRSCALLVANKLEIPRDAVLDAVKSTAGIDLYAPEDGEALERALDALEAMRMPQDD